jgi:cytochrome c553
MTALNREGCVTVQAEEDADTNIVAAALHLASKPEIGAVAVAADDTDILVMLVHHVTENMTQIYFVPHPRKITAAASQLPINIRAIQKSIGSTACRQLLTVHALGGCDTTSAIFRMGKGAIFKKITNASFTSHLTDVMQDSSSLREDVVKAGQQLMILLYGGKTSDDLTNLRYTTYCRMAAVSLLRPQPERLPPTERATYFHSLRVHLQAVRWKTLAADELDAKSWGWAEDNAKFIPIMTDWPAAPEDILNVVRCKCKAGCKSSNCSCRANSLSCVTACSNCHGEDCSNAPQSMVPERGEEDGSETDTASEDEGGEADKRYYYFSDMDCVDEEEV